MSSLNNICGLAGSFSTNNNSVGSKSSVPIDMRSQINFNNISCLKLGRIISARREVASNFIDRNAAWESYTSLKFFRFFVAECLLEFFINERINCTAHF